MFLENKKDNLLAITKKNGQKYHFMFRYKFGLEIKKY